MQQARGCGRQGMMATLLGKERLTTCPRYFVKRHGRAFSRLAELYAHYKNGFLPDRGGIQDQSALTMEALQIFGAGVAEGNEQQRTK